MTNQILFAFAASAAVCAAAESPPVFDLTNGSIRARFYLPDEHTGFYRGTRFDWAGVIGGLEYAGHDYYPQWFDRGDPAVRDFIYDGAEIVAGPNTAITGPAEEFSGALGFDQAKAGGTFVKIGVGVLQKPAEGGNYDAYRRYSISDSGKWTITRAAQSIQFRHQLSEASNGYAYDYEKTVSFPGEKAEMLLAHRLRNTGKLPIRTSVYNHNFLYLDRQPPGPDFSLIFPFQLRNARPSADSMAEVRGNQVTFSKTLKGEERVYLNLEGFGSESKDYDIRIENRRVGVGVRITSDRPISRLALWAIRAPLSIEPFININIAPGAEFTWQIKYEYYRLAGGVK